MEWISVEDRLPQDKKSVVVTDGLTSYAIAWYGHNRDWVAETDLLDAENYDGHCHIELDANITHWMPLPDPPKE